MSIKQLICLSLYYGFARYLPNSHGKFSFLGGGKLRSFLCRHIFKKMGSNVNIERKAYFGKGTNVEIGGNSGIGINCHIHPNTVIGNNVMMGPNLYMLDNLTHRIDRTDIPMIQQGVKPVSERCRVIIGDDIWIGQDVMILGSKTIAKGSIIGARTVLTKNFPEYSIVGGNPSRLIRTRK